ncbi:MAG: hypothetical protein ACPLYE_03265 [Candidatus Micrarchaeales archaeon]
MFVINYDAKYLLDAAYDSTDIYQELNYDNVKPVIFKTEGNVWSGEEPFRRNQKIAIFAFSCPIAYLVKYVI